MTVVAYRGGVMAADSRSTDAESGHHVTVCDKVFRLSNGAILGCAGDDDDRDIQEMLTKATPSRMPSRKALAETEMDFAGIMVFPNGRVFRVEVEYDDDKTTWGASVFEIKDTICAVGTGAELAVGAMEAGATPEEAVVIACRRDVAHCALPVQSITLTPPETATP